MSTMMACPPGTAKKRAFVPVVGDGFMLRYNSKLPLVIYARKMSRCAIASGRLRTRSAPPLRNDLNREHQP